MPKPHVPLIADSQHKCHGLLVFVFFMNILTHTKNMSQEQLWPKRCCFVCETFSNEIEFVNRFFDWFINWFINKANFDLWTISKSVHVLCPFSLLVTNRFVNRFFVNPSVCEPFFAKRFTIMVSFMGWFLCSAFAQQPEIYEPIYEPIYIRAHKHVHWGEFLCGSE